MSGHRIRAQGIQEDVSPNLIPMIDIMFLLLLFFMLGADMGKREIEEVILPQAKEIKDDTEAKGQKVDRLTINIRHLDSRELQAKNEVCKVYADKGVCRVEEHWRIGIRGGDYTDLHRLEELLATEAKSRMSDPSTPGASERQVMIRADGASPYGHVKDVMNTCAKVGIYRIECGAARPPAQKGQG